MMMKYRSIILFAAFVHVAFFCRANIQDFAGVINTAELQDIESLIGEVNTQRGWTILVSTFSSGIPQIPLNAETWLSAGPKRIIFMVPTVGYQSGEIPLILASSDLTVDLSVSKIEMIIENRMMPDFNELNYAGAIIKGIEALLISGIEIQEITFENNRLIENASSPEWKLGSSGEITSYPLCYRIGSMIKMIPVFVNDTPISGSVKIKANIKGADYVVDGVSSDDHITTDENGIEFEADHFVGYEEKRLIKWSVSFNDGDWLPVGESGHKLFFTLEDPAVGYGITESSEPLERYLYFSCNKAKGKSTKNGVLNALWNAFDINNSEKLKVGDFLENNIDKGKLLYYYGTSETSQSCLAPPYYDGECSAWSKLLAFSLAHQGFEKGNDYRILEIESTYFDEDERIIVKNWQFIDEGLFNDPRVNEDYSHRNYATSDQFPAKKTIGTTVVGGTYEWIEEKVKELPGIPGQNNPNPFSDFSFHAIVEINSEASSGAVYYDPSYGVRYFSVQEMYSVIQGFCLIDLNFETIIVNGQSTQVWPFLFRENMGGETINIHE